MFCSNSANLQEDIKKLANLFSSRSAKPNFKSYAISIRNDNQHSAKQLPMRYYVHIVLSSSARVPHRPLTLKRVIAFTNKTSPLVCSQCQTDFQISFFGVAKSSFNDGTM